MSNLKENNDLYKENTKIKNDVMVYMDEISQLKQENERLKEKNTGLVKALYLLELQIEIESLDGLVKQLQSLNSSLYSSTTSSC